MYSDSYTKPTSLSVLILDDEKNFAEDLQEFLVHIGFNAKAANLVDDGFAVRGLICLSWPSISQVVRDGIS
jgi:ActR/RegA family two-component response regulator